MKTPHPYHPRRQLREAREPFLIERRDSFGFPELDRCTVMQHLKVLEGADLVIARREGRERWNHLNSMPIKQIHDRWIGPYAERAVTVLERLKGDLEA